MTITEENVVITLDNFKEVLIELGFIEDTKKKVFNKQCNSGSDSIMSVDFANEKLIYPSKLKAYRETTKNFSQNENFVVFECIARLLIKGYKPEHIELEKPMPGGHHDTGGFCDILIKDNDEKTFLLIECKKADEFDAYWKKMLVNGGQLFNYYNSYRQAQALCLYTSDYTDEVGLKPTSHIVSMIDNDEYLQSDRKLRSFRQVQEDNGGKDEYFKVWKETYQLDYNTRGIFEDDIAAYTVGKLKYTVNDLIEVDNDSIQKKYHEFATILRQHNVGSHENAFDKLVNLFLAKIVDELVNADELQFYWRGAAHDDYFSLQDRLQKLYKDGMEKFLGEQVTYIDQKEISEAFHLFKNDPDATRSKVLEYFRQLKFFTNNDFAFLDVHNEKLFYQNAIILKKIVQMLEDIKLKTEEQNQFLGDLFEGFLDQGVKQSEGQYFTPMPIVKFLVSSLPLENMIQNSTEIPYAIDYACGAGHFLNEYASCIKTIVEKHKLVPVEEYYKRTLGIEKEYRLSKVSKVSAFMYGQDDIQIIYGDALAKNSRIENNKYSVLIANPPYSVKGFLETLTEEERDNYTLSASVSDLSKNNSIETFFIERAKQLLKADGVAAIVLPISILTNGSIYIPCREIILKYFDIIAIAEFASGTFGKTPTTTITLFLRRRKSNPDIAEHYQNRVDSWFSADTSKDIVFEDDGLINEYCSHCEIDVDEYKNWLNGGTVPTASIFVDYSNKIINSTVYKNIQKKKITKRYVQSDKNTELENCITNGIRTVEKEKLYYYMLAASNSCSVIVIKSPTDSKKSKEFLGYDWSGAKGSEGIKYIGVAGVDDDDAISKNKGINSIKTPLFDPNNYDSNGKINTIIRKNYIDGKPLIPDTLAEYVKVYNLTDMLDFSRVDFDKAIRTSGVKRVEVKSKYPIEKLGKIAHVKGGNGFPEIYQGNVNKKDIPFYKVGDMNTVGNEVWMKTSNNYVEESILVDKIKATIFSANATIFPKVGMAIHTNKKRILSCKAAIDNNTMAVWTKDEDVLLPMFLYEYLVGYVILSDYASTANPPSINATNFKNIDIPIPPIVIQQQIVSECEKVDKEYADAVAENEKLNERIGDILNGVSINRKHLKSITSYATKKIKYTSIIPTSYISTDNMLQNCEGVKDYDGIPNIDKVVEYKSGDILVSNIRPYLKKIWFADKEGGCSPDVLVFRVSKTEVEPKYLYYVMKQDSFFKHMMDVVKGKKMPRGDKNHAMDFQVSLPSLSTQQQIISEIEEIEEKISANKSIMAESTEKKKKIIGKALA